MSKFSNYKSRKVVDYILNFFVVSICLASAALIFSPIFFYSLEWVREYYGPLSKVLFFIFILSNLLKYLNHFTINSEKDRALFKRTIFYTSFALLFLGKIFLPEQHKDLVSVLVLSLLAVLGLRELIRVIVSVDKRYTKFFHKRFTGIQVFVMSFFITIVVGTLLLLTPKASVEGLDFIDALFMAVSATCVTGLTVVSTQHDLTQLGQLIVLFLFQIGGLGTMTFAIGLSGLFNEGLSFNSKVLVSDIFNSENLSNIKRILKNTFLFTFTIETIGAIYFFLTMPTIENETLPSRIFYSVFHAVSAFCNAGFSLNDSSVSSVEWSHSPNLLGATCFLIVIGGLGFPVLLNVFDRFRKKARLTLHTKVVLSFSLFFLVLGSLVIFFLEKNQLFSGESVEFAILNSIFTSVTSRTAGFNSVNFGSLSDSTLFLISGLMFIGGAPMSTAGGLKVTTFAVAFSHLYGRVRKYKNPVLFNRALTEKNISSSLNIISLSLVVAFFGVFLISIFDGHNSFVSVFFEVFSALGTVGLSTGITSNLSDFSKIIIIILMFVGRVNILVFFDAIIKDSKKTRIQHLKEDIVL